MACPTGVLASGFRSVVAMAQVMDGGIIWAGAAAMGLAMVGVTARTGKKNLAGGILKQLRILPARGEHLCDFWFCL